jgi:hypothetical protein
MGFIRTVDNRTNQSNYVNTLGKYTLNIERLRTDKDGKLVSFHGGKLFVEGNDEPVGNISLMKSVVRGDMLHLHIPYGEDTLTLLTDLLESIKSFDSKAVTNEEAPVDAPSEEPAETPAE